MGMDTWQSTGRGVSTVRRWVVGGISLIAKPSAITAFFVLCSVVYGLINEWAYHSPRTRYYRSPRDDFPALIQPWTAVVYVFGGYVAPFLPFVYNWAWPRLRFVLQTYVVSSVLMFAVFLIAPVGMHRPAYAGESFGERLMLAVFAVDRETNCFPSGHTVFAVLSGLLVSYGSPPRWVEVASWLLAASICVTTVTTGQHYYADIAAGVLTALVGFLLSLRLERFRARRVARKAAG